MTISSFTGRFTFLSNFSSSALDIDGILYPTAEHAFQAGKTTSRSMQQQIALAVTPGKAKRLGRSVSLREDWEQYKIPYMRRVLEAKFAPHTGLANKLLGTGGHYIMEGNDWGDRF